MSASLTCPECGSPLNVERQARVDEDFGALIYAKVPGGVQRARSYVTVAAFCSGCEFALEVQR